MAVLGPSARLFVGLDVGGTFTDTVVMDESGQTWNTKAPTTPHRLEEGVLESLALLAQERQENLEQLLSQVVSFGHGTTQATNVLVERSGARTALLTTRGFGDTIFIQRLQGFTAGVPDELLGFYSARRQPPPVVPRELVFEVPERIDQAGDVLLPLDEEVTARTIETAYRAGAETLAVCLLWAMRNPAHELRIRELAHELVPKLHVSLSHEVAPVVGEYERTSSTMINAYVSPRVRDYLTEVEDTLRKQGFCGSFRVLSSAGGVMSTGDAAQRPVELLGSGPAGGVIGSQALAASLGHSHVITTDMGGTSFDVGLIVDGKAAITAITQAGGYHLATPSIEITAIGAGGGSIAAAASGTLSVGPHSAGADPGPVCYRRGGELPTVTDADVVLGILSPTNFLGGRIELDREAAERAIDRHIARPLGLSVTQAAAGIRRVVDAKMAGALRQITIGRGHDPRDFVLYAYGGAGPMHCGAYGGELGVGKILVPARGMVQCAFGALHSNVVLTLQAALSGDTAAGNGAGVARLDADAVEGEYERLEREARRRLEANGIAPDSVGLARSADVRYRRQTHELIVPFPGTLEGLVDRFEAMYEDHYGRGAGYREAGIEITTLRVQANGEIKKPPLSDFAASSSDAGPRTRDVTDPSDGTTRAIPIYRWHDVRAGQRIEGPTVIEHPTTTVYIGRSQRCALDRYGNLEIEFGKA